jgi:hypothetical protein
MSNQANPDKVIIGRAERIQLVDFSDQFIPAKVDTGADLSSIWASDVKEGAHSLSFVLFDTKSPHYTGKPIKLSATEYKLTRVANSFGTKELRYAVKLRIRIHDRVVKTTFTLADRQLKTYPVLLGRRLLNQKFLVDVSKGEALKEQERNKKKKLKRELKNIQ